MEQQIQTRSKTLIAIDPGTDTGLCVYRNRKDFELHTLTIIAAIDMVRKLHETEKIKVYIENPNLRKWFGTTGREKLQGAGSIKRDFAIWKEVFISYKIEFVELSPANIKGLKMNQTNFNQLTGYLKKSSVHARDAAMMVWGR
jgi:hypothetical protein